MKYHLLLSLVIVTSLFPIAMAEITLTSVSDSYTIGDSLTIGATIVHDRDVYGFLSLVIECDKGSTEFYRVPVSLSAQTPYQISDIALRLTSGMANNGDSCLVRANTYNHDLQRIMHAATPRFAVSYRFDVSVYVADAELNPGDTFVADISIEADDTLFSSVVAEMTVGREFYRQTHTQRYFTVSYQLPDTMSSGKHPIRITIEDRYGNIHVHEDTLSVASVPTRIQHILPRQRFYANQVNETLLVRPVLYDQGNTAIKGESMHIRLFNPRGEQLAAETLLSGHEFLFVLQNTSMPGDYRLVAEFHDIVEEAVVVVLNSDYVVERVVHENATKDVVLFPVSENALWQWLFFILLVVVLVQGVLFWKFKKKTPKDDTFYNFKRHKKQPVQSSGKRVYKAKAEDHRDD